MSALRDKAREWEMPARVREPRGKMADSVEIGWAELVQLPDLGLDHIRAKIDTGAATSSIHATRLAPIETDDGLLVEFWTRVHKDEPARKFTAPAVARRKIKSSNGEVQLRYVIETRMRLGDFTWTGHLTLANRRAMAFPILIGRRALARGFRVNCARRWMLGRPEERDA
ncbi:ATP-dependent zinc protease [Novosphingopyxis sp.]|uniref:ATP-dependent zinc protease family protein n=1 Tax=Novosphingopyxis sp. TaxID=2709690 RepID=UPI003B5BF017